MNNTTRITQINHNETVHENQPTLQTQVQQETSQINSTTQTLAHQVLQNTNTAVSTVINLQNRSTQLSTGQSEGGEIPVVIASNPTYVAQEGVQFSLENLEKWVENGGTELNKINRQLTVVRIKNAYNLKKTTLDLEKGRLTTFPQELGALKNLKMLLLSHNRFKSLPEGIHNLKKLEKLHLSSCKLNFLPPQIFTLTNLTQLVLHQNNLMTLPHEICALNKLQILVICENKLNSLPPSIGTLPLRLLSISQNPDLNELPMSLGQISSLLLIIHDNQKLKNIVKAIMDQCEKIKTGDTLTILQNRLTTWALIGEVDTGLSKSIDGLSEDQKKNLNEWLVRLEKTRDFSRHQVALAKTVCDMVGDVVKNKEFCDLFFTQVVANNECCRDRAAMALNEIYSAWKIMFLPSDAPIILKLNILTGVAKTLALRKAIASRIDKQQKNNNGRIENESVEIYLYYETTLKKSLRLQSAIEAMSYQSLGKRDWIKIEDLVEEVYRTFFYSLFDIPVFMNILYEDSPEIKERFQKLENACRKKIKERPNGTDLAQDVLDWHVNVNILNEELTESKQKIAYKRYAQILNLKRKLLQTQNNNKKIKLETS